MDINIQKYMAFLATAEYGSFTRAAEILNYSQSGVSRMIHDLETEWNVSLLERGRAGVRLTSDGTQLLPGVRAVCEEYRKLQGQVDEMNGLQSGLIRIGAFSSAATHWIPNIIEKFRQHYPRVTYELLIGDYTEIANWIMEGRVDCGFLRLPAAAPVDVTFLENDRLLVILPEHHPLAGCDVFPLEQLREESFILQGKGLKAEAEDFFETYSIHPKVYCTTWDDYAIMSMVERGAGISLLPELILRRVPYRIVVKELDVPVRRGIGFAVRNQKTASLAVKRFMEYLHYR